MQWAFATLLCASLAIAQDAVSARQAARNPAEAQSRYRNLGAEALAKEHPRSKAGLCSDADTLKGGNAQIGRCLDDELAATEKGYLAFVRSIGALLRVTARQNSAQPLQKKLPFDLAEEAWQIYRDKSCASMASQWEGGDQAPVADGDCRLKLTWNHMNELAELYSDLWDGHLTGAAQAADSIPEALKLVIAELKQKSHIPLLLPSKMAETFGEATQAVLDKASDEEYSISLFYELGMGNAGFAANFTANAHPDYDPKDDLPNVDQVKLPNGLIGYFQPVSCGGSCAPANLWWKENETLYQIQLKLSSTLSEGDQQKLIIAAANSAILAGPR